MKKENIPIQQTIIGVDLGDKKHAICVTDKNGKILKEFSISNTEHSLTKLTQNFPNSLIAIEVGTHSPWISRLLSSLGCEVIVANARKLRVIYTNERKCDQLDALMLAKIARLDPELLHPVKHRSEEHQKDMSMVRLRDMLVRQRATMVVSVRFTLKSHGIVIKKSGVPAFSKSARSQLEGDDFLALILPILKVIDELSLQIKALEKDIIELAQNKYPDSQLLQQIPGVGPITALSFVLLIGDANRFHCNRDVAAYLGLVPRRDQSGNTDKQLPISKTGDKYLRKLLVQAAHYILGPFGADCDLRRQGLKIAERGGKSAKRKAVVAIARKLSVLMLSIWKNQSSYKPLNKPQAA